MRRNVESDCAVNKDALQQQDLGGTFVAEWECAKSSTTFTQGAVQTSAPEGTSAFSRDTLQAESDGLNQLAPDRGEATANL
jgi:hypothetical protein